MDSLVVDVPTPDGADSTMWLFAVLADGVELDEELEAKIRRRMREHCSPRHVPDRIVAVAEVPRTLSGKKLEVPVKKILMGGDPERAASRDSLANPEALDFFVELGHRRARLGLGSSGPTRASSRSASSTQNSSAAGERSRAPRARAGRCGGGGGAPGRARRGR